MALLDAETALLVTLAEFERAAQASLKGSRAVDGQTWADALADAQAACEAYVGRPLFVHAYVQGAFLALTVGPPEGRLFAPYYLAERWPVVEVVTQTGAALEAQDPFSRRLYAVGGAALAPGAVTSASYFAGYRGAHHVLDDPGTDQVALPDLDGLEDLTVLPPLAPRTLTRTIIALALLYLNEARQGTLGSGRRTQLIGSAAVTVEAVDTQAEERLLHRIDHLKPLL